MSVIAITGANRGIGLALCRQLSADHEIHALCRSSSLALDALSVHVHSGVDVRDPSTVPEDVPNLDILINNAGILRQDSLSDLDVPSIEEQFIVNSLGPLRMTLSLLPKLSSGSKVVIITSRMGSVTDNTSGGMYGYRMSKAAVNMAGMSLSCDLKPKGIAVALLHPGFVRTDMTGGNGYISAKESAKGLITQIMRLSLDNTGSFWHCNGEDLPW
jgi:NAD(P)-dependent dehydrogenase (short-subunit alcohol dehydrogenase family)